MSLLIAGLIGIAIGVTVAAAFGPSLIARELEMLRAENRALRLVVRNAAAMCRRQNLGVLANYLMHVLGDEGGA